jgi:propanol-preferring alcohol dehydrogenase
MRAMLLRRLGPIERGSAPLESAELPVPEPGRGEIRIKISVCGVCHTELDEIEGRTEPARLPIVPGHEIVGRVDALGPGASGHAPGDRVGVGWIHHSSGGEDENLSPQFRATGRDVDGGYAEYMTVPQTYAYPVPDVFSDAQAGPLLCAGGVGYRALRLTGLRDGQRLGLTGFGGSAHLVLQICRHLYPSSPVYVFARDPDQRTFAEQLGAVWTGATEERSPDPLDAVIDTTPAWRPVLEALRNLKPGGRLVINAIRKEDSDKELLSSLSYHEQLWMEREIKSVANVTHKDLAEFLPLAAQVPLQPEVQLYPLERANQALSDLKFGPIRGAKVLQIGADTNVGAASKHDS